MPDFLAWLASGNSPTSSRVVVIAAHPDDETIGLGAQLRRMPQARILHVTDGAPRDARDVAAHGFRDCASYAAARREELAAALRLAGLGPGAGETLAIPDQEASLDLAGLTRRLVEYLAASRAEVVVTHAYEGGHPDHDATAFAVHAALRLAPGPLLVEMAGYHAGPEGIAVGDFLPGGGPEAVTLELTPDDHALKRRMMDCFVTQRQVLASFPVGTERLRPAPRYNFTVPPHPGRLFYDNFPWGMTSDRFRHLAADALARLGLEPAA